MRRPTTWGLLLALGGCGVRISGAPADLGNSDAAIGPPLTDAGLPVVTVDAPAALGPWGAAAKVPPAATTAIEDDVTLSANALEMVFAVDASAGNGTGKDLYYTSRATKADPWTAPAVKLPFDSTMFSDEAPRFSADDKTLFFASARGNTGALDIYQVTRAAAGSTTTWGKPAPLSDVNTNANVEKWYSPCGADQKHYVMVQGAPGAATHLVEGDLGGGAPKLVTELNAADDTLSDTGAFILPSCLEIYFASFRVTPEAIFHSTRATMADPWSKPAQVVDFAGIGGNQEDPWVASDSRTFVFASDASGTKDIYISTR